MLDVDLQILWKFIDQFLVFSFRKISIGPSFSKFQFSAKIVVIIEIFGGYSKFSARDPFLDSEKLTLITYLQRAMYFLAF